MMIHPERVIRRRMPSERLCQFQIRENDTYEIVFWDDSDAAVDIWMAYIEEVTSRYAADQLVRFVVDVTRSTPSFRYVLQCSKDFVAQHPQRPRTRTLVVYDDSIRIAIYSVLHTLLSWLRDSPHEQALFCRKSQREEGMAWLREDE